MFPNPIHLRWLHVRHCVFCRPLYRPWAWGRAAIAGLFTGAGIMFSGVIWFALLGAAKSLP
jgi:hypothetical protein